MKLAGLIMAMIAAACALQAQQEAPPPPKAATAAEAATTKQPAKEDAMSHVPGVPRTASGAAPGWVSPSH